MSAYEKANEFDDIKSTWIIGNIGNLFINVGLWSVAIPLLRKAVVLNPEHEYIQNRLARAHKSLKEEKEKEQEFLNSFNPGI